MRSRALHLHHLVLKQERVDRTFTDEANMELPTDMKDASATITYRRFNK